MGAYENPEIIVDTQTGQHLRNLQATIAGSFSNYAKTYAERESDKQGELKKQQAINTKKLYDDQKEVEDYALALRTKMGEAQEGNKQLNLSETFEPLIQEAVKLKSGLLNGSIQDRQAAIAKIAKINGSVSGFTSSLAEFDSYSNDLENVMLKPIGVEGGLSQEMPAGDIRAIRIMQGRLPGSKKAIYEDGDPDKLAWEIYEPGSNVPIKKYYANKMTDMDLYSDGNYVRTVPDMSVSNEKLKNTVSTVFETKTQTVKGEEVKESTGRLTDAMLATKKDMPQEIDYQKEYIGGQPGVYKLVAKVDKNKVMNNGDIGVLLKSRISGMTDSEIIIYNNNILDKTIKDAPTLENTTALTEEQRTKFLENYKEHFWNTQVKHTQDLLKEDSSVETFQDPKPTESTIPKSNNAKPYFSEAQIDDYKNKYVQLVNEEVTELVVPSKGGQRKFIFNKEKGVVQEVSADMLEVRNNKVSGPYFRETILGIPAKTKPKLK
jgi:hypothetical protein